MSAVPQQVSIKKKEADTIPFDDFAPGTTVRVKVVDNNQYLSIRDIIMRVSKKNNNDAGEVWRNLSPEHKSELQEFILNIQFPGRGQSEQPVITFPGALKLVMFLPGKNAKHARSVMAKILVRYFAGDPTLLGEIEANAASGDPVPQMARESLSSETAQETLGGRKRKHLVELQQKELEMRLMQIEAQNKQHDATAKGIANTQDRMWGFINSRSLR